MRRILVLLLLSSFLSGCVENRPQTTTDAMVSWLSENGQDPVDYVVSSFKDHDIVFLGEDHRVKHDSLFVQSLIPELYDNGIYVLGMELLCSEDQERIDRLLTASEYNDSLACALLRHYDPSWAYQEYVDILYAVWRMNEAHPEGPAFRIVGLSPYYDRAKMWFGTEEEKRIEEEKTAQGDRYMADVIKREILPHKALIYCGSHHAFTRYHQLSSAPGWQPSGLSAELTAHEKEDYWYHIRTGNYILDEIGNRTMTIRLHGFWSSADYENYILPCKGTLDKVAIAYDKPVAFDIQGSPFEDLGDPDCDYAVGHDNLTLFDLYGGYIILSPITEFEPVTVVSAEKWVNTPEALEEVLGLTADKPYIETGEEFMKLVRGSLINIFALEFARSMYIASTGREPVDIKSVVESSKNITFVIPQELRDDTSELVNGLKKDGKIVRMTSPDDVQAEKMKLSGLLVPHRATIFLTK